MPEPATYVRRSTALQAMQFTGDEESAAAIIGWTAGADAFQLLYRGVEPNTSDDEHPDLVLHTAEPGSTVTRTIRNTDWVVIDHDMVLRYSADLFAIVFEPTEAPA